MEEQTAAGFNLRDRKTILAIVGFLILLAGLPLAVYLAQQKQIFKPKAFELNKGQAATLVSGPETSFTLKSPSLVNIGEEVRISLLVKSDIDAANLFVAKLKFPTEVLEVKQIITSETQCSPRPPCLDARPACKLPEPAEGWCETPSGRAQEKISESKACIDARDQLARLDSRWAQKSCAEIINEIKNNCTIFVPPNSIRDALAPGTCGSQPSTKYFIKNWVEKIYDNKTGNISLIGGVPNPGYQTDKGQPSGLMAEIVFKAKNEGLATLSFGPDSAIYRNRDNVNILNIKREVSFKVQLPISVTPAPTACTIGYQTPDLGASCLSCLTKLRPSLIGDIRKLNPPLFAACTDQQTLNYWCNGGISQEASAQCQGDIGGPCATSCRGTIITPTPVGILGDVSGDGKVDLVDMSALLSRWNEVGAGAGRADLNQDGRVNTIDYSMMIKILLEKGIIKSISEVPLIPLR